MSRGQSLVELAVCAPVILLLTLSVIATVQVFDAQAGLEAATQAAAGVAARAPDPATAQAAAQARFAAMVVSYPLRSTDLRITLGEFSRTNQVVATSSGAVDVSWASLFFAKRLSLEARAAVPLESWRTHRP